MADQVCSMLLGPASAPAHGQQHSCSQDNMGSMNSSDCAVATVLCNAWCLEVCGPVQPLSLELFMCALASLMACSASVGLPSPAPL
jgi:hypothetical protein